MHLHYYPSYCGGRILTGLTCLELDKYNKTVDGYRVSVMTLRADGARTDRPDPEPGKRIDGWYKGRLFSRAATALLTFKDAEEAKLEVVKNILIEDGLMNCNRISYETRNSWGDDIVEVETFDKTVFSRSIIGYGTTGRPTELQQRIPEDLGDFQLCLHAMLKHHGDFKFVYAVTNTSQEVAAGFLEASGFKCTGTGKKNVHASTCKSWQGDSKEVYKAIESTLTRRQGLSEYIDALLARLPTPVKEPVVGEINA